MIYRKYQRSLPGLGIAAALAMFALAPTAAASSPPPMDGDGPVTVLDAGDPTTQVVLPGTPTMGTSATVTSTSTTRGGVIVSRTNAEQEPVEVTATVDVTTTWSMLAVVIGVGDDGGFSAQLRVNSYEIEDNSVGMSALSYAADRELEPLVDALFVAHYGPTGKVESAEPVEDTFTDEQLAALDEFVSDSSHSFPTDPVGAGAQWSSEHGGLLRTYTLSSLDGDDVTIDASVSGDASAAFADGLPEGFTDVTGSVSSSATLTGVVGSLYAATIDVTGEMEFTLSGPDTTFTADLQMTEHRQAG